MSQDQLLEAKLRTSILPYFISARRLPWRPLYVAHTIYSYTRDVLAGLVGFGAASPLLAWAVDQKSPATPMSSVPAGWMGVLAVAAAGAWLLLKVFVTRGDGDKRATLARSCRKEFRRIEVKVHQALQTANPMPGLNDALAGITSLVDRHIVATRHPEAPFT